MSYAASKSPTPSSLPKLLVLTLLALVLFGGFIALGTWQVHRLSWKLALIARVHSRVHAPLIPAPGRNAWQQVSTKHSEFLHVRVKGHFLNAKPTLVHAPTKLGYGYWVLTPMRTQRGFLVLINRGYIPSSLPTSPKYKNMSRPTGERTVTGLLRITEPGGTLLRSNKPKKNRWYSRDVHAIARSDGLPMGDVAPYFIDAAANLHKGKYPVGGLTVIHFRNEHLSYAITWYCMAALTLLAAALLGRYEYRKRKQRES